MKAVMICTLRCNYSLLYVILALLLALFFCLILLSYTYRIKPQKPFISTFGIPNLT